MIPLYRQPRLTDSATDVHGDESSRVLLYRALIGKQATDYYLEQFSRFDEQLPTERTWNASALLFTFSWLIHRKMWGRAFLYLLLPFAYVITLAFARVMMPDYALFAAMVFALAYVIFLFGMVPRIADRQYHGYCMRKIEQAHKISPRLSDQLAWLQYHGGTTHIAVVTLVSVLAFVATTGCFEAIQRIGQRRIDVDKVYWKTQNPTQWISEYYAFRQMLPETLADANYHARLPEELEELSYNAHTGTITATLALNGLEGRHLIWTPGTPHYIELQWTCSSPDIADFYLPPACKAHRQQSTLQQMREIL